MSKIRELSLEMTNQIAAGEVVERPASVVKELLENAIDAKSQHIVVKVEEAGLKAIEVIDDGEGMDKIDAQKALERYATSKIHSSSDLFRIRTLGFRGEALPSIASISHVTITTANEQIGTKVYAEFGQVMSVQEIAKARGTTVTVTKLFNNTPARLRFMKSLNTEFSKIVDVVNRLALSYPFIQFELWHNGKSMMRTPGNGQLLQAVAGIYHTKIARAMRYIKAEDSDFKIEGYISEPLESRSNRHYMSCYINGRYIRHYPISQAILKGYGSTLMVNRYPVAVLLIETDPLLVDVNVHPSKLDVRLSKAEQLEELIRSTIAEAIGQEMRIPDSSHWTPQKSGQRKIKLPSSYLARGRELDNFWARKAEETKEVPTPSSQMVEEVAEDSAAERSTYETLETPTVKEITWQKPALPTDLLKEDQPQGPSISEAKRSSARFPSYERTKTVRPSREDETNLASLLNELDYVGQIHGTYLVLQAIDGFYLMDQHAAQERIRYERILADMSHPSVEQQHLLLPMTINLSADQVLALDNAQDIFETFGLVYEIFGDRSIIFRTYPTWLGKDGVEDQLTDIVDQILSGELTSLADYRKELAASKSCKGAIKANHYLTPNEVKDLLLQLAQCKNPYNCPHGRPVMIFFSTYDIERLFKRIQDH